MRRIPFLEELKQELLDRAPTETSESLAAQRPRSGAWTAAAAFSGVVAFGLLTWMVAGPQTDTTSETTQPTGPSMELVTADEILEDGEITNEERTLARQAVYECLAAAGADTTLELFDVDPIVKRDYWVEYNDCFAEFRGIVIDPPQPAELFDLSLLAVVECVEDRLGRQLGPKTVDEIGRLTQESLTTIEAALDADRDTYLDCQALPATFDPNLTYEPIVGFRLEEGDPKRVELVVDSCGYFYGARLESETDTEVVVSFTAPGDHVTSDCWTRHPVRLKDPLGGRPVIDAATDQEIDLLEPTSEA